MLKKQQNKASPAEECHKCKNDPKGSGKGKGGEGAMNWLTGDCWEVRGSGGDPPLKARMDSVLGWTSALAGVYMVNCVVMTPVGGIILKPSGRLVGGRVVVGRSWHGSAQRTRQFMATLKQKKAC